MTNLQTLIGAASVVGVVALVASGISSSKKHDVYLRAECIQSGGSVIPTGFGDFACVGGATHDADAECPAEQHVLMRKVVQSVREASQ